MLVLRRMDRSPCVRLNFLLRVAFCGWRDGSRRWLEARRLAWRRGDLARFHARKWGVLALATAFFVWRHIHRAFALRQKEKAEYVRLSFADYTIDSELLSRKHELWRAYDSGQLDKIEQQDVHNVITIQRVAAFKAGLLMAQFFEEWRHSRVQAAPPVLASRRGPSPRTPVHRARRPRAASELEEAAHGASVHHAGVSRASASALPRQSRSRPTRSAGSTGQPMFCRRRQALSKPLSKRSTMSAFMLATTVLSLFRPDAQVQPSPPNGARSSSEARPFTVFVHGHKMVQIDDVSATTTVWDLMLKIAKKDDNFSVRFSRLSYMSRGLDPDSTLSASFITGEANLFYTGRGPGGSGGGPIPSNTFYGAGGPSRAPSPTAATAAATAADVASGSAACLTPAAQPPAMEPPLTNEQRARIEVSCQAAERRRAATAAAASSSSAAAAAAAAAAPVPPPVPPPPLPPALAPKAPAGVRGGGGRGGKGGRGGGRGGRGGKGSMDSERGGGGGSGVGGGKKKVTQKNRAAFFARRSTPPATGATSSGVATAAATLAAIPATALPASSPSFAAATTAPRALPGAAPEPAPNVAAVDDAVDDEPTIE